MFVEKKTFGNREKAVSLGLFSSKIIDIFAERTVH